MIGSGFAPPIQYLIPYNGADKCDGPGGRAFKVFRSLRSGGSTASKIANGRSVTKREMLSKTARSRIKGWTTCGPPSKRNTRLRSQDTCSPAEGLEVSVRYREHQRLSTSGESGAEGT